MQNVKLMIINMSIHDHRFDIRHWAQNPQLHVGPFHTFYRFLNAVNTLLCLMSLASVFHRTQEQSHYSLASVTHGRDAEPSPSGIPVHRATIATRTPLCVPQLSIRRPETRSAPTPEASRRFHCLKLKQYAVPATAVVPGTEYPGTGRSHTG